LIEDSTFFGNRVTGENGFASRRVVEALGWGGATLYQSQGVQVVFPACRFRQQQARQVETGADASITPGSPNWTRWRHERWVLGEINKKWADFAGGGLAACLSVVEAAMVGFGRWWWWCLHIAGSSQFGGGAGSLGFA